MKRNATAVWQGSGKEGKGHLTTQSTVLNQTQYSFYSRFENGVGTNPEELIAAAHAGCFTMKLCFNLGAKGYTPINLETTCDVFLENGVVQSSTLHLNATVMGISEAEFEEVVNDAKLNCPVSKLLRTNIQLNYQFINAL
ncbi:MAG: OsmC family protein [Bacteroidota bacterium]